MSQPLTKTQFIKFVEDLYLTKLVGQPISEDAGGYLVKIQDDHGTPGARYNLYAWGPTGRSMTRLNVSPYGISHVASTLYDEVTEFTDRVIFSGDETGTHSPDGEPLDIYAHADDERDHTEEAWQRAEAEREGLAELAAEMTEGVAQAWSNPFPDEDPEI